MHVPTARRSEFLITVTIAATAESAPVTVDAHRRQAEWARQLAEQGVLARLWTLPVSGRVLGLWQAPDPARMAAILASQPLHNWTSVQTTELTPHPSDPALTSD